LRTFPGTDGRCAVPACHSPLPPRSGRYLALQLSGGIPHDASIPIASLNAQRVLATEARGRLKSALRGLTDRSESRAEGQAF